MQNIVFLEIQMIFHKTHEQKLISYSIIFLSL